MGKVTGFLDYQRKGIDYLPVAERVRNFNEFIIVQSAEEIRLQGARCMDCGIPYCHALGCPVYNLIPEWNDLVYQDKWHEAFLRLELTNNLPEITGRICPAPCEASCTLSINDSPITIKQLELAIIEKAFSEGWVVPRPPRVESGKKVAVIGSGPAGLAAAQQLRRFGHRVVVFEKDTRIGGLLRYGIPDFKLEKWVLDRRIEQMKLEGVEFEADVMIGEDLSVRYLKRSFDSVLLCMGAGEPRNLNIQGRYLEGVHFAMEYLVQANKRAGGEAFSEKAILARDKIVVVIGGGDTGSDCVGTAIRQGAKQVYQYEIMPKPPEWQKPSNPQWPYWPNILRSSSSHLEGCQRDWSINTVSFSGNINVEEANFTRVGWAKDQKGQFTFSVTPGSEFSQKVDLVLLAMGFLHVEHSRLLKDFGVELDLRGNIKTPAPYATSVPGVYTAGDANTGASLVVRAIFHGREAAACINSYLGV